MNKEIFLVEDGGFGGWALHAFVICTSLKEEGLDVHLLTNMDYEFDTFDKSFKVSKIFRPIRKKEKQNKLSWVLNRFYTYFINTRSLLKFLGKRDNYILHFYSSNYFLNGPASLFLKKNVKVFSNIHDIEPHYNKGNYYMRLQQFLTNKFISRSNKLIVFTKEGVQELGSKIGTTEKVAFIEHGQVYLPGMQSKYGAHSTGSKLNCLCFGSVRPNKGFEVLLKSMADMSSEERAGVSLKIVGKAEDPSYCKSLADFIQENALTDCVDFQDRYVEISEIHKFFSGVDLLILPYTHFHSQSGVIYLGHSFGVPVLVTDLAGLKEHIEKTSAGFMVKNSDPQSLKDELLRIMQNKSLLDEKRLNVKKYMANAMDGWKTISKDYSKLYESIG